MLDLAKLATLRTVVECGSFSAAADTLHLTQPAVSRQIALLERQLGVLLVTRTQQGVRVTEAGRILLAHTDTALASLDRAEEEIRELTGMQRGTVRLGSFFSALVQLSAEVSAQLAESHPGLRIIDDLVDRSTAMDKLRRGTLDLAIVFEADIEPVAPVEGVNVYPLFDDPLCVVLPLSHRLAERSSVTVDKLAQETWIRPHDGSAARRLDNVLARAGVAPPILLAGHGDEPFETQALVAAGRGITLTHQLTVIVSPHEVVIRRLRGISGTRQVQVAVAPGRRPQAVDAALRVILALGRARADAPLQHRAT